MIESDDAIKDQASLQTSLISPDLYLAYIILGITVLLVLIFTIVGILRGNIKKTLISVGLFAAVILVSYFGFAGDFGMGFEISDTETLSLSGAKWIGTGLYSFYILALVAILAMVVSTVKKAITS
ncbi:hypothetical protein [Flavobacteriaceae bacterium 14752]|uniref:hypothetical protein n=1 Tax=Mesohalobacter salilacus TaxID=2491711 RepID=UPI000F62CCC5|nr:hypothetical protein EIG84_06150 [Flavobacteriaceae bacterium 14752]